MSKLDSLFTAALAQAAQRQVRGLRRAIAAPPGRPALDGRALVNFSGAPGARFIVAEGIVSMDGNRADVAALADCLARRWPDTQEAPACRP